MDININKTYSVYAHINKINGLIYIGITSNNPYKRWANGCGYSKNEFFSNAIKKYGWDGFRHVIILDGLSSELANEVECKLIKIYETTDRKKGYNIMNGGNSNRHTDYTKQKIKENHHDIRGEKNPFYGKKHSEETIIKIKETLKGRFLGEKSPVYKRKHTQEEKIKMSQSRPSVSKENNPRAREIFQFDLEGNFIRSFWGCIEAKELFGYDNSAIAKCCKGKVKTSYGYIWRYSK